MTRRTPLSERAPRATPDGLDALALDDRRLLALAEAAPARPEDHREHGADRADNEQDDADRVQVEAVACHVDCERQNGAGCDQDEADSDTHCVSPLTSCVTSCACAQGPEPDEQRWRRE